MKILPKIELFLKFFQFEGGASERLSFVLEFLKFFSVDVKKKPELLRTYDNYLLPHSSWPSICGSGDGHPFTRPSYPDQAVKALEAGS